MHAANIRCVAVPRFAELERPAPAIRMTACVFPLPRNARAVRRQGSRLAGAACRNETQQRKVAQAITRLCRGDASTRWRGSPGSHHRSPSKPLVLAPSSRPPVVATASGGGVGPIACKHGRAVSPANTRSACRQHAPEQVGGRVGHSLRAADEQDRSNGDPSRPPRSYGQTAKAAVPAKGSWRVAARPPGSICRQDYGDFEFTHVHCVPLVTPGVDYGLVSRTQKSRAECSTTFLICVTGSALAKDAKPMRGRPRFAVKAQSSVRLGLAAIGGWLSP